MFDAAGGGISVLGTYPLFEHYEDASSGTGTLMKAIIASTQTTRAAVTNGQPLPATLSSTSPPLMGTQGDANTDVGWLNWNIIVPTAGTVTITATVGSNPVLELDVDDRPVGTTAAPTTVKLLPGLHTVQVKNNGVGIDDAVTLQVE
jgi:hypothetical protein